MDAKFLVNPSLKTGTPQGGVDFVRTDMLMLTKMSGLGLGPSPLAVDDRLAGKLSEKIRQKRFKGNLGENLMLQLGDEHPARNVLLVGLGNSSTFDFCGLQKVIDVAITRAVSLGCKRLSLEIAKDRLTGGHLNLRGTAHSIKECVLEKLSTLCADKPGTIEIELICTPQAARHLKKGLSIPRRAKQPLCTPAK
jgi:hypothetical protein